jgi:hypothetical protein
MENSKELMQHYMHVNNGGFTIEVHNNGEELELWTGYSFTDIFDTKTIVKTSPIELKRLADKLLEVYEKTKDNVIITDKFHIAGEIK